jgi:hypothetical protein
MAKTQDRKPLDPLELISQSVVVVRDQKVLLDEAVAKLYGVTTKALNQAVKRHADRFPEDFLFRLTAEEVDQLNRPQTVPGSQKHRDRRHAPFAFTELGIYMASGILKTDLAVAMSVHIARTSTWDTALCQHRSH